MLEVPHGNAQQFARLLRRLGECRLFRGSRRRLLIKSWLDHAGQPAALRKLQPLETERLELADTVDAKWAARANFVGVV